MTCSAEGCERAVLARGLCNRHNLRANRRRRMEQGPYDYWTEEEERFLLSAIGNRRITLKDTYSRVAKMLNRSPRAVETKALRIRRKMFSA